MSNAEEMPGAPEGLPESLVEEKITRPRMYQVLLHNDNYTTMEFVVTVLMDIFHKSADQATAIMLAVHKRGVGIVGAYPFEIAEIKKERTHSLAIKEGYPLRCTLQEVGV